LAGVVIVVVYKPQAVIMSQIDIETGGRTNGRWLREFCPSQNVQWDYHLSRYIRKVPAHFRSNHEHFEPRTWQFGLHNRSIGQAKVADEIKMSLVRGLRLSADQWLEFCAAVVPDPQKVQLIYLMYGYAMQSLEVEDIRKLLTLDALFLVAYLLHVGCKQSEPTLPTPSFCSVLKNSEFAGYETTVWSDVCLVENQIPLELLSNVISWLRGMTEGNCNNIPPWSDKFWRRTIFRLSTKYFFNRNVKGYEASWDKQFKRSEETYSRGTYGHILDIVYHNLNGQSYLSAERTTDVFKRIPSATTLKKSGVTFKSNSSSSLADISFQSGCLQIPYIYLDDGTEQWFRNLVLHELLEPDTRSTIRSYTLLMGDLIRTEDDERILVDAGVIGNGLDRSNAHKMWKEIHRNVEPPRITEALSETLDSIYDFTRSWRNTYWVKYKQRYCSRPCSAFAVFVVVCTAIQTYIAITSSNHMKPTFKSSP
jgi:hypothetical protein